MAKTNVRVSYSVKTHGGAPAFPHLKPIERLRRSVMACMLWENEFYEDGASIATRIEEAAHGVTAAELAAVAIEARQDGNLRHAPLWLLRALVAKGGGRIVGDAIYEVISRADEIPELLSLYWKDGKRPLAKQLKIGIARAFHKFDAYQLSKYDRPGAVRLRDALFLSHAKPKSDAQRLMWAALAQGTLPPADTWEVGLSGGADKRETFERLLREGKLGYLALLRNLRNMQMAGVSTDLIESALIERRGAGRVLPFRFVAALRAAPMYAAAIDKALTANIREGFAMEGMTIVLVDVSGSMSAKLSEKSDLTRMDAAAAIGALVHSERKRVLTFSDRVVEVAPFPGLAGINVIVQSQPHGSTYLSLAVEEANKLPHDRLIVVTDEQATGFERIPAPVAKRAYMINVASATNGVGYGKWTHLDGFSESILRWIRAVERSGS